MKRILIVGTIAIMMAIPSQANAFSLKRFLSNPLKVSISSVLNPFHLVYKVNKAFGYSPTTGIPRAAFTDDNEKYFRNTNQWRWDDQTSENYWKRPIGDDFHRIDPMVPPPDVITNPPCNRGGKSITPC